MEYTINKLAKLAGVSTRTLRWYEECGLLSPCRIASNGYRIYGQREVDRLQQILFYRELGVELSEIGKILSGDGFDALAAMEEHLLDLRGKRDRISLLITNVEKSIMSMKGEISMTDLEKFEGFKQKLIDENEEKFGGEIRAKYGNSAVDSSNARLKGKTQEELAAHEELTRELNETIRTAVEQGDPTGQLAVKAAELHKRWLCFYWENYSKEAHIGVAQMYTEDARFTAYYDEIAVGAAKFLRDAVKSAYGNAD
jgi:DNA-binding transcriptional MerR regulator